MCDPHYTVTKEAVREEHNGRTLFVGIQVSHAKQRQGEAVCCVGLVALAVKATIFDDLADKVIKVHIFNDILRS